MSQASLSVTSKAHLRKRLRTSLSPAMFALSLLFLAGVAALLVLSIDIPRTIELNDLDIVTEFAEDSDTTVAREALPESSSESSKPSTPDALSSLIDREHELVFQSRAATAARWLAKAIAVVWMLFLAEQLAYVVLSDSWQQYWRENPYSLAVCLVPPLRMCSRHHAAEGTIWFPGLGWQKPTPALQRALERHTSVPMIGIALLILPVLALQLLYGADIVRHPVLRIALHIATGLIWFAFATEFIVMVSVTDKKLRYCKKHWLDLVIILLPLVSFLRSWQLLRASKLVKFSKLQQMTKIIRAYRLRGVTMRALRAFLVLELTQRIMRVKPEKRLAQLEELYAEKEAELAELREQIDEIRRRSGTNSSSC